MAVTALLFTALIWSVHELPAAFHTVSGDSMHPGVQAGQIILVNRYAYLLGTPEVGDVVVFRNPLSNRLTIKRLAAIADGPLYYVVGDNRSESVDSRHYGALTRDLIIGRVELLGRR